MKNCCWSANPPHPQHSQSSMPTEIQPLFIVFNHLELKPFLKKRFFELQALTQPRALCRCPGGGQCKATGSHFQMVICPSRTQQMCDGRPCPFSVHRHFPEYIGHFHHLWDTICAKYESLSWFLSIQCNKFPILKGFPEKQYCS